METMGERLKYLRVNYWGINQVEMAARLGVSKQNVSFIERGQKIASTNLEKLIKEYNVNANWLIAGKGDMFISDKNDIEDPVIKTIISNYKSQDDFRKLLLKLTNKDKDFWKALLKTIS